MNLDLIYGFKCFVAVILLSGSTPLQMKSLPIILVVLIYAVGLIFLKITFRINIVIYVEEDKIG